MKGITSKEEVLKRVRDALVNTMPAPYDVSNTDGDVMYMPRGNFREEQFVRTFNENGGKFVFCADVQDMANSLLALIKQKKLAKLYCRDAFLVDFLNNIGLDCEQNPRQIHTVDATITACEALVVRHGSVVFSSRQESGRKSFSAAPVHIVVATSQQFVDDLTGAFHLIKRRYGKRLPTLITFVSGPSRTADIEKTLVHGAHGPKELYLFMLDIR